MGIMGELFLDNGLVIPDDGLGIPSEWDSYSSRMGERKLSPRGELKVITGDIKGE